MFDRSIATPKTTIQMINGISFDKVILRFIKSEWIRRVVLSSQEMKKHLETLRIFDQNEY
jgi:hypothetical protein